MESSIKQDEDSISIVRPEGLMLVLDTPKGRGLFASKDIPAQTIIDIAPVLVLDPKENEDHVRKTDLYNYTYNWPYRDSNPASDDPRKPKTTQAVVFGLGSLFNHSRRHQNVGWTRVVEKKVVVYKTLREIRKGEELCISYGDRLTFVDTETVDSESDEDEDGGLGCIDII